MVVSTEREARVLSQFSKTNNLHVVPNGVDTNYFKPLVSRPDATTLTVAFVGDMSYFPNQEAVIYFARQVLPIIHQSLPNVRFLIIGRNPSREVQRLQKIMGVEVTGSVPDVRTFLSKAQVSVAPFSIAAGIQQGDITFSRESMVGLPPVLAAAAPAL